MEVPVDNRGDADLGDMVLPDESGEDLAESEDGVFALPDEVEEDLAELGAPPLPPFGVSEKVGSVRALPKPGLHKVESLNILLIQSPNPVASQRMGPLLPTGVVPRAHGYGTLRRFPATHHSSGVLTVRNAHELPQILFHDPKFQEEFASTGAGLGRCAHGQPFPKATVSTDFAEWLMGFPLGWTSVNPLLSSSLSTHSMLRQPAFQRKHLCFSLFSGIGGLEFALSPWCRPLGYCESDPAARAVLAARMADGSLHRAPIFEDVRSLSIDHLREAAGFSSLKNVGFVLGFPCQDTSKAGKKRGLNEGTRSCLVYEALRLATSTLASFLFIENVDHVRFVHPGAATLVESLCALGYFCRWVSLSATNAGSPQRRQRWFLLASREAQFELAVPADSGLALLIEQSSGVSFNGGRPPVRKWMVPKQSPSSEVDLRLSLLGNSVVPLQVALAARLLSG